MQRREPPSLIGAVCGNQARWLNDVVGSFINNLNLIGNAINPLRHDRIRDALTGELC